MIHTDKPLTHGGKRAGAGRKPSGRKPYLIRMNPKTFKQIKREAGKLTVGMFLEERFNIESSGGASAPTIG